MNCWYLGWKSWKSCCLKYLKMDEIINIFCVVSELGLRNKNYIRENYIEYKEEFFKK